MDKIAIVGAACLFPGAETPEAYWRNLVANKDSRVFAGAEQMGRDPQLYFDANKDAKDKYYCTLGGYIQDFRFDPEGYALAAERLAALDVSAQWSLHVAREALRDAGYLGNAEVLRRCGAIVGNLSFPTRASNPLFLPIYHQAMSAPLQQLFGQPAFRMGETGLPQQPAVADIANGMVASRPATLVAQALGLQGGTTFAIDAACATSLYSLKLACLSLLAGHSDLMLAGAVSAADPWFVAMGFSTFKAFPENIPSRPLDKDSAGLNTGEGAGMFVLKRYEDALRDGDAIQGVIRAVGLSNDGKGKFVLSPSEAGQATCYERAYREAGLPANAIDYLECHATGTPLGDDTEIRSMTSFFGGKDAHFDIGSVKSNFGHLLTAAGSAGLLKIILGLKNDLLPATIGVVHPIDGESTGGSHVLTANRDWPKRKEPRHAAISAFGFGGTNAHLILEEHRAEKGSKGEKGAKAAKANQRKAVSAQASRRLTPLRIVGMGAHFGSCRDLGELENTLFNAKQHFGELPPQRWQGIDRQAEHLRALGFADGKAPRGNYLDRFDLDYLYFKIPPQDQAPLIPQQLLMMKVLDEALKDAGLPTGGNVGVIVAMEMDSAIHQFRGRIDAPFALDDGLRKARLKLAPEQRAQLDDILKDSLHNAVEINQFTSFIGNIIPCRICSLWDFSGPAFTLSSEENSVAKALQVAQLFLDSGEVEAMVVGAVDLAGGIEHLYLQNRRAPVDGAAHGLSFEQAAQGWIVGEGAGAVVLKAGGGTAAAGEKIYATIEGIGSCAGVSAESLAQAGRNALQQAGIEPDAVDYIELNASGVKAQDDAEAAGLRSLYRKGALGSVKANIGHTFAAAGMASLIKTALCLRHRFIPAIPAWQAPADPARWADRQYYFPDESRPWLKNSQRRHAAINSIGSDDSCHHLILAEAQAGAAQRSVADDGNRFLDDPSAFLFLLTGNAEADLAAQLDQLEKDHRAGQSLKSLALTRLQAFRKNPGTRYRLSLVASDVEEFERELQAAKGGVAQAFATGKAWSTPQGSYFTPEPLGPDAKIAFVYPGGFNSYVGMARELFQIFPALHREVIGCTSSLRDMMRTHYLYPQTLAVPDKAGRKLQEQTLGDDAIAMFESGIMASILYTKVIKNILGVNQQAAFGHSMGELSMLYASGAWSSTDSMSGTLHSSATFETRLVGEMDVVRQAWGIPGTGQGGPQSVWGTYTLRCAPEAAAAVIAEEPRVFLIMINSPGEIVIAGDDEACRRVVTKLKWRLYPVPIKDVVHNELVRAEFDALKSLHTMPTTNIPGVDFYTAADYRVTRLDQEVIANNIATFYCQMIDFPRLVNQVYADGARIFIELGPQSSCTKWIGETLGERPHLAAGINRKGADELTSLLRLAGRLTSHGVPMQLEKLFPKEEVAVVRKGPSLIKPVVLGNRSLAEVILAPENRGRFQPLPVDASPAQAALSQAGSGRSRTWPKFPLRHQSMRKGLWGTPVVADSAASVAAIPSARATPSQAASATAFAPAVASAPQVSSNQQLMPRTIMNDNHAAGQGGLLAQFIEHHANISRMHGQFLAARQAGLEQLTALLMHEIAAPGSYVATSHATLPQGTAGVAVSGVAPRTAPVTMAQPVQPTQVFPTRYSTPQKVVYDQKDLVEFAYGKIARVFGPEYAVIDAYPRRVMLPMDPYLLVTRVTEMQARRGEYVPSKMTTEYDIPHGAWYSTDGQIPVCVCIESGQCDLLLISYMGIDFENKGEYLYRLLDCTLTFLDDQPKEGQTLRYEISINSFARHQHNLLFFFSYNCYIGDKLILKMTNGCAGFFNESDLAKGKGVIRTKEEIAERGKVHKSSFAPLLSCNKTSFDHRDIERLTDGDLAGCFANPAYDKRGRNPSLRFPKDKILMIDRITSVERSGGLWGLGQLEAEKDLHPDGWYFTSHFRDDPVLAGSLMSEGCVQLMQFYMLYLGLHVNCEDARFQTKKNIPQVIRCRGECLPKHRTMTYRLEITEIGMHPKPYCKGNVEIIVDGRIVVDFRDMCLELSEKTAEEKALLAAGAAGRPLPVAPAPVVSSVSSMPSVPSVALASVPAAAAAVAGLPPKPRYLTVKKPALFDEIKIDHFATGEITACFGPEFAIYDEPADPPRRPPRTPNGYLQLMHRVLSVDGKRHDFSGTSYCVAEYDVAPDEWFCKVNSYPSLTPYSMMMEIALQPNGFLTSQMGTTLIYPKENLYFRNLDGEGTLFKEVDLRGRTITNKSSMYSTSAVMNNIIQKFTFELLADGETFYKGSAVFGFFSAASLKNQVGMDKGKKLLPWHEEQGVAAERIEAIDLKSPAARSTLYAASADKPHYRLAGGMLDLIDAVKIIGEGGQFGKGYVHALKTIDPSDWFYPCHFHLDPVMPGSLGVEAMIQSMQIFALRYGLGAELRNPRFGHVLGTAKWQYRGQIIPANKEMTLEVHIKEIRRQAGRVEILADGNLWKDGLRIYHVEDLGLSVQEG